MNKYKSSATPRNWDETLREIPFVRLTFAFLLGIIWQDAGTGFAFPTITITLALGVLFVIAVFLPFSRHPRHQWLNGGVALLFLFSSGSTIVQMQPQESRLPQQEDIYIKAVVCDDIKISERFIKAPVVIVGSEQLAVSSQQCAEDSRQSEVGSKHYVICREKCVLYLEKDSCSLSPQLGDSIFAKIRLLPIAAPQHPGEFNYKTYMRRRGVFSTAFVRAHQYIVEPSPPSWKHLPARLRAKAESVYENTGLSGDELAIIQALCLGDKKDIDADLRASYSATGAAHILAVSGL
ncbi:MAG: ComEC family competence protein, partial [Prevotellaceae bacterium]|nr:ComEC family competence protein [Prevotellaceae bacterium]